MELGDIRRLTRKRPDLLERLQDLSTKHDLPPAALRQALSDTRKQIAQPFSALESLLTQIEDGTFIPPKPKSTMTAAQALTAYQSDTSHPEANIVLLRYGLRGDEDPLELEEVYI